MLILYSDPINCIKYITVAKDVYGECLSKLVYYDNINKYWRDAAVNKLPNSSFWGKTMLKLFY